MLSNLVPNELLNDDMTVHIYSEYGGAVRGNITLHVNTGMYLFAVLKFKDCKLQSSEWFITSPEEVNFRYRLSWFHKTGLILTTDEVEYLLRQAMEWKAHAMPSIRYFKADWFMEKLLTKKSNALDKGE